MRYSIEDFRLAVEKCNNAELLKNLLIELVENSGICDGRSMPSITELDIEPNEEDDLSE
jgi:hypothetical protein